MSQPSSPSMSPSTNDRPRLGTLFVKVSHASGLPVPRDGVNSLNTITVVALQSDKAGWNVAATTLEQPNAAADSPGTGANFLRQAISSSAAMRALLNGYSNALQTTNIARASSSPVWNNDVTFRLHALPDDLKLQFSVVSLGPLQYKHHQAPTVLAEGEYVLSPTLRSSHLARHASDDVAAAIVNNHKRRVLVTESALTTDSSLTLSPTSMVEHVQDDSGVASEPLDLPTAVQCRYLATESAGVHMKLLQPQTGPSAARPKHCMLHFSWRLDLDQAPLSSLGYEIISSLGLASGHPLLQMPAPQLRRLAASAVQPARDDHVKCLDTMEMIFHTLSTAHRPPGNETQGADAHQDKTDETSTGPRKSPLRNPLVPGSLEHVRIAMSLQHQSGWSGDTKALLDRQASQADSPEEEGLHSLVKGLTLPATFDEQTPGLQEPQFVAILQFLVSTPKARLSLLFRQMDANGDRVLTWDEYISYIIRHTRNNLLHQQAQGCFVLDTPPFSDPANSVRVARGGLKKIVSLGPLQGYLAVLADGTTQIWSEEFIHCISLDTTHGPLPPPYAFPSTQRPPALGPVVRSGGVIALQSQRQRMMESSDRLSPMLGDVQPPLPTQVWVEQGYDPAVPDLVSYYDVDGASTERSLSPGRQHRFASSSSFASSQYTRDTTAHPSVQLPSMRAVPSGVSTTQQSTSDRNAVISGGLGAAQSESYVVQARSDVLGQHETKARVSGRAVSKAAKDVIQAATAMAPGRRVAMSTATATDFARQYAAEQSADEESRRVRFAAVPILDSADTRLTELSSTRPGRKRQATVSTDDTRFRSPLGFTASQAFGSAASVRAAAMLISKSLDDGESKGLDGLPAVGVGSSKTDERPTNVWERLHRGDSVVDSAERAARVAHAAGTFDGGPVQPTTDPSKTTHDVHVIDACFDLSKNTIVAACSDQTIRMFDVSAYRTDGHLPLDELIRRRGARRGVRKRAMQREKQLQQALRTRKATADDAIRRGVEQDSTPVTDVVLGMRKAVRGDEASDSDEDNAADGADLTVRHRFRRFVASNRQKRLVERRLRSSTGVQQHAMEHELSKSVKAAQLLKGSGVGGGAVGTVVTDPLDQVMAEEICIGGDNEHALQLACDSLFGTGPGIPVAVTVLQPVTTHWAAMGGLPDKQNPAQPQRQSSADTAAAAVASEGTKSTAARSPTLSSSPEASETPSAPQRGAAPVLTPAETEAMDVPRYIVADSTGHVAIHHGHTYQRLGTLRTHCEHIFQLLYIPKLGLVVAGSGGPIVVCDPFKVQVTRIFGSASAISVRCLAWSSREKLLFAAGFDGQARVWNPYLPQKPIAVLQHGQSDTSAGLGLSAADPVSVLSVNDAHNQVITLSQGGRIQVFDLRTFRCLQAHHDSVVDRCKGMLVDIQRLGVLLYGSHVRVWKLTELPGNTVSAATAALIDLVSADVGDAELMQRSETSDNPLHRVMSNLLGVEPSARRAALSGPGTDQSAVASARMALRRNSVVAYDDSATGEAKETDDDAHDLATARQRRHTVRRSSVVGTTGGSAMRTEGVAAAAALPFAVTVRRGSISERVVRNVITEASIKAETLGDGAALSRVGLLSALYSPAFHQVASVEKSGNVTVWDMRTGAAHTSYQVYHTPHHPLDDPALTSGRNGNREDEPAVVGAVDVMYEVVCAELDAKCRRIVTAAAYGSVRLWSFSNGELLRDFPSVGMDVTAVGFHGDDRVPYPVLAGGWAGRVVLWKDESLSEELTTAIQAVDSESQAVEADKGSPAKHTLARRYVTAPAANRPSTTAVPSRPTTGRRIGTRPFTTGAGRTSRLFGSRRVGTEVGQEDSRGAQAPEPELAQATAPQDVLRRRQQGLSSADVDRGILAVMDSETRRAQLQRAQTSSGQRTTRPTPLPEGRIHHQRPKTAAARGASLNESGTAVAQIGRFGARRTDSMVGCMHHVGEERPEEAAPVLAPTFDGGDRMDVTSILCGGGSALCAPGTGDAAGMFAFGSAGLLRAPDMYSSSASSGGEMDLSSDSDSDSDSGRGGDATDMLGMRQRRRSSQRVAAPIRNQHLTSSLTAQRGHLQQRQREAKQWRRRMVSRRRSSAVSLSVAQTYLYPWVAVAGTDGTIEFVDLRREKRVWQMKLVELSAEGRAIPAVAECMVCLPTHRVLLVGTRTGSIQVVKLADGAQTPISCQIHQPARDTATSKAVRRAERKASITGQADPTDFGAAEISVTAMAADALGARVMVGFSDGQAALLDSWSVARDAASIAQPMTTWKAHTHSVQTIQFITMKGAPAVFLSSGGVSIKVWGLDGALLARFGQVTAWPAMFATSSKQPAYSPTAPQQRRQSTASVDFLNAPHRQRSMSATVLALDVVRRQSLGIVPAAPHHNEPLDSDSDSSSGSDDAGAVERRPFARSGGTRGKTVSKAPVTTPRPPTPITTADETSEQGHVAPVARPATGRWSRQSVGVNTLRGLKSAVPQGHGLREYASAPVATTTQEVSETDSGSAITMPPITPALRTHLSRDEALAAAGLRLAQQPLQLQSAYNKPQLTNLDPNAAVNEQLVPFSIRYPPSTLKTLQPYGLRTERIDSQWQVLERGFRRRIQEKQRKVQASAVLKGEPTDEYEAAEQSVTGSFTTRASSTPGSRGQSFRRGLQVAATPTRPATVGSNRLRSHGTAPASPIRSNRLHYAESQAVPTASAISQKETASRSPVTVCPAPDAGEVIRTIVGRNRSSRLEGAISRLLEGPQQGVEQTLRLLPDTAFGASRAHPDFASGRNSVISTGSSLPRRKGSVSSRMRSSQGRIRRPESAVDRVLDFMQSHDNASMHT